MSLGCEEEISSSPFISRSVSSLSVFFSILLFMDVSSSLDCFSVDVSSSLGCFSVDVSFSLVCFSTDPSSSLVCFSINVSSSFVFSCACISVCFSGSSLSFVCSSNVSSASCSVFILISSFFSTTLPYSVPSSIICSATKLLLSVSS